MPSKPTNFVILATILHSGECTTTTKTVGLESYLELQSELDCFYERGEGALSRDFPSVSLYLCGLTGIHYSRDDLEPGRRSSPLEPDGRR